MASTTMRVFDFTKKAIDDYAIKVNKHRAKKGKSPLNKTEVIALAVSKLTICQGVES